MTMFTEVIWQLFWLYITSLLWQILSYPLVSKLFKHLNDGGWASGRVFTTVGISFVMWTLSSLNIKVNTNVGLLALIVAFSLVSLYFWERNFNFYRKDILKKKVFIISEEIVIFIGILLMGIVRAYGPALNNLEKFMDLGFVKQYLLADKLPVVDMWMGGKQINYYSFGHYWMSVMIRWLQVKPEIGFGLLLAYFFGQIYMLSMSMAINLMDDRYKKRLLIFGGVLSGSLVCLGGNSHILWFVTKYQGFWNGVFPYWYGVATRVIPGTITEFPSYTFTVGDLHPHLIDLPIVLTFLLLLIALHKIEMTKLSKIIYLCIIGFFVGVMIMTNTWDGAIYVLLWGVLQVVKIIKKQVSMAAALFQSAIIIGVAVFVSATWWWTFVPIPQGVALVRDRSSIKDLLVLWSAQWIVALLALINLRKKPMIITMVMVALVLIVIPELIYVVDIYKDTPRANTIFKLTYQSFLLFSLLGGAVIVELIERKKILLTGALLSIFSVLCLYPLTSYSMEYQGFKKYQGLDGQQWQKESRPQDYDISEYLSKQINGKNLIEYTGHSFTQSNSVSVFSGVPTVLGWREHEWLWRGRWDEVRDRIQDIDYFYSASTVVQLSIIKKYNIGWIKVSDEERKNYQVNDDNIKTLGDIVWQDGNNYLIKVRDGN